MTGAAAVAAYNSVIIYDPYTYAPCSTIPLHVAVYVNESEDFRAEAQYTTVLAAFVTADGDEVMAAPTATGRPAA